MHSQAVAGKPSSFWAFDGISAQIERQCIDELAPDALKRQTAGPGGTLFVLHRPGAPGDRIVL